MAKKTTNRSPDISWDEWIKIFQILSDGYYHYPTKKDSKRLELWITEQRNAKKQGTLDNDKIQELDALGFVWLERDEDWAMNYEKLCAYAKTNKLKSKEREIRQFVSNPKI